MMTKKMTVVKVTLFLILSYGVSASMKVAHAEGAPEAAKIGVVDMQKALQAVEAGKKAKGELEKQFNAKKKELQTEEAAIKKATEEFKKQSVVLSDDARAKKQQDLQERIMKFQQYTQQSQMDIQQKERELTAPIIDGLKAIISETAKSKGYTTVLEKSETTVLFSLDRDDLTQEIVATYDKKHKK